jgi:hypothetical protein
LINFYIKYEKFGRSFIWKKIGGEMEEINGGKAGRNRSNSGVVQFGGRDRLLSQIYRIENAVRDFIDDNKVCIKTLYCENSHCLRDGLWH